MLLLMVFGNNHVCGQDKKEVYRLVTDINQLFADDTLVFVNQEHKKIMASQKTNNRDAVEIELSGNTLNRNTNEGESFVLKGENDNWSFLTFDNKYLYANGKDNNNYLKSKDELDKYGKAKISIYANGNAEIIFQGETSKSYCCSMQYNSTSQLFSCYKKLNGQEPVQIFKKVTDIENVIIGGNYENDNNAKIINDAYMDGKPHNIEINRSFVGDGGWYTLCLPFALTQQDIKTTFKNSKFYEFSDIEKNERGGLQLNFKNVKETTSGTPYLIQPVKGSEIVNPMFENKLIDVTTPLSVDFTLEGDGGTCSFVGVFNPTLLNGKNIRFVGSNGNNLVIPNGDNSKLKALRAYIIMPDNITAASIKTVDSSTAILITETNNATKPIRIYNLNGMYIGNSLDKLPSGIYIMNHKKIVKR